MSSKQVSNFPCICGHEELNHKFRDKDVDGLIVEFINSNSLIPQHHPDLVKITHFMIKDNSVHTYEEIYKAVEDMRTNGSECRWGIRTGGFCNCQKFKLDNLKYLEQRYNGLVK